MMGLFMLFFANNRRLKGGNIIEMDLDWLFHFILLLVLILLTKLKVHIKYSHAQDNDSFKIQLKAWFGLLNINLISRSLR